MYILKVTNFADSSSYPQMPNHLRKPPNLCSNWFKSGSAVFVFVCPTVAPPPPLWTRPPGAASSISSITRVSTVLCGAHTRIYFLIYPSPCIENVFIKPVNSPIFLCVLFNFHLSSCNFLKTFFVKLLNFLCKTFKLSLQNFLYKTVKLSRCKYLCGLLTPSLTSPSGGSACLKL